MAEPRPSVRAPGSTQTPGTPKCAVTWPRLGLGLLSPAKFRCSLPGGPAPPLLTRSPGASPSLSWASLSPSPVGWARGTGSSRHGEGRVPDCSVPGTPGVGGFTRSLAMPCGGWALQGAPSLWFCGLQESYSQRHLGNRSREAIGAAGRHGAQQHVGGGHSVPQLPVREQVAWRV